YSTFFLTWNSNKEVLDPQSDMARELSEAVDKVFEQVLDLEDMKKYVKCNPPEIQFPDTNYFVFESGCTTRGVERGPSPKVEWTKEIGDKQHRFHVHFYLYFKHKTKTRIDFNELKECIVNRFKELGYDMSKTYLD